MSNSSKNEKAKLTSSRELAADELNQVTGGMGPVLIFRQQPDRTKGSGGNVTGGWDLIGGRVYS